MSESICDPQGDVGRVNNSVLSTGLVKAATDGEVGSIGNSPVLQVIVASYF